MIILPAIDIKDVIVSDFIKEISLQQKRLQIIIWKLQKF